MWRNARRNGLAWARRCDYTGGVTDIGTERSNPSIYEDGTYLAANEDWHAADSPFKANWIDAILTKHFMNPRSIAEIGCGAGGILLELQKRRPEATFDGYDTSPHAIALCAPKQGERVHFHQADLLEQHGIRFDALIAADVFEHVPDYMGFIRAMKSFAEYKIFHIPLDLSVQALLRGTPLNNARKSVGHLHYFSKDTALATLKDCGLEVVDWDYTDGAVALPTTSLKTRVANVFRRLVSLASRDFAARLLGGYSMIVIAR